MDTRMDVPPPKSHLVDAAEGGHVDGLPPHDARRAHTRGVLAGAGVDDGVHHHLPWMRIG